MKIAHRLRCKRHQLQRFVGAPCCNDSIGGRNGWNNIFNYPHCFVVIWWINIILSGAFLCFFTYKLHVYGRVIVNGYQRSLSAGTVALILRNGRQLVPLLHNGQSRFATKTLLDGKFDKNDAVSRSPRFVSYGTDLHSITRFNIFHCAIETFGNTWNNDMNLSTQTFSTTINHWYQRCIFHNVSVFVDRTHFMKFGIHPLPSFDII